MTLPATLYFINMSFHHCIHVSCNFLSFFLVFFFLPNSYLISSLLTYLIMTKMERRKVVAHNKILDPASISKSEGIRDFRFVAIMKTEKTHFFSVFIKVPLALVFEFNVHFVICSLHCRLTVSPAPGNISDTVSPQFIIRASFTTHST